MKKWLILLTFLFLISRLPSFWMEMAEDEQVWTMTAVAPYGFNILLVPHPPIMPILLSLAGLFGNWRVLHIIPLFFSLCVFLLTIIFAKKLFNEKSALYAGFIILVSMWAVLTASQIEMDGSIVAFMGLVATYFYLSGVNNNSIKDYVFAGVALGIGLLTKTTIFLFILSFIAYNLWIVFSKEKKLNEIAKSFITYLVCGIIFSIYYAINIIFNLKLISATNEHVLAYFFNFFSQNFINVLSILSQAIVLISPLLLGLFVLSLFRFDKKNTIFYILIGVHVFFYLFISTPSFRPFERYWMPVLPYFALLGGFILDKFKFKRKEILITSFLTVLLFVILELFSFFAKSTLLPLYPKEIYIQKLMSGSWNFLFPFHGASGPLGFFVPFWSVFFTFVVSSILIISILATKRKKQLLILFLSISIAFNLLMISEYYFSPTTPNLNKVSTQVTEFALKTNLQQPVYIYQGTGHFLLNYSGYKVKEFNAINYNDEALANDISNSNSTFLIVDFPSANRNSIMWQALSKCKKDLIVIEKGLELGYVLTC